MIFNTLSGRILGLAVLFVLIAEVLVFVPSVARFRMDYLQNRLDLAQLGALAALATPENEDISPGLQAELLETADVFNVVLRRDGIRQLVLEGEVPEPIAATFDLGRASAWKLTRDALKVYLAGEDRVVRVIGMAGAGDGYAVEVTMYEGPLRKAMIAFGLRVITVSLAIIGPVAALLFFAIRRFIVRPIDRVVASMVAYRDAPEDATRMIAPESDVIELRQAETALHELQLRLTGALRQRERLAALGGAVAKISHDLRNLLTTAQLLADRIEGSDDPSVARTAPKLVASLSRAITLCERTLTYGRAEEAPPSPTVFALAPLVEEVVENETDAVDGRIPIEVRIPDGLRARADADQLFRVLTNLVRNAVQAISASGQTGAVAVSAKIEDDRLVMRVRDTGPGLPEKARQNLFQPFRGGARQGGSGLGLVIAAELIRGHGGTLDLESSGPDGTTFRLALPLAPARC
jgi:signal transduction histidine kinase